MHIVILYTHIYIYTLPTYVPTYRSLQNEAAKAGIGGKFNKELLLKPIHSFQWDDEHRREIRVRYTGVRCGGVDVYMYILLNNIYYVRVVCVIW